LSNRVRDIHHVKRATLVHVETIARMVWGNEL
jgi:hypothetical protein